jgi:NAD(P)-dependent dehydrogenase (short-subunit alcohol dehydrogenase family)
MLSPPGRRINPISRSRPAEEAAGERRRRRESRDRVNLAAGILARTYGRAAEPREIADAIAFLASERSAYTSGVILTLDGGLCVRGGA